MNISSLPSNATARILAIDDQHDTLEILTEYLHGAGYQAVSTLSDPFEALPRFVAETFDLVLLDLVMPGLDGFAVMAQMQALGAAKACPILVLTARQDEQTRLRALQAGARDFLAKPFVEEELLCRVGNLLEMHLAQRRLYNQTLSLEAAVLERTEQLEERNRQLTHSQQEMLERLALVAEFRDNETGLHVLRMSRYAQIIGQALGLDEQATTLLLQSAAMHDIGKVGIPDAILLKPGPLDLGERQIMMGHTTIGARILADSRSPLLEASRLIALSHHECWDGSGYPRNVCGEQIPLFGRISAVADVFDALTSQRPYKAAWSVDRAVAAIQAGSGSQFDPYIVSVFIGILPGILTIKDHYQDGEHHEQNA